MIIDNMLPYGLLFGFTAANAQYRKMRIYSVNDLSYDVVGLCVINYNVKHKIMRRL